MSCSCPEKVCLILRDWISQTFEHIVSFKTPKTFFSKTWGDPHTLICLSSAPVARYFPSGLKQTLRMYKSPSLSTDSSCNFVTWLPVVTSKICAERLQPVATYRPSKLNLTQQTTLSWGRLWTRSTSRTRRMRGLKTANQSRPSRFWSGRNWSGSKSASWFPTLGSWGCCCCGGELGLPTCGDLGSWYGIEWFCWGVAGPGPVGTRLFRPLPGPGDAIDCWPCEA